MKKYQWAVAASLLASVLGTSVIHAEMNGDQPETPAGTAAPVDGAAKTDMHGVPKLSVEFQPGRSDIPPTFTKNLDTFGQYLKNNPQSKASIIAYADHTGAAPTNAALSQKRADAVGAYLTKNFGVSADRITARGYGEVTDKLHNDTESAKQANRRAIGTITNS